MQSFSFDYILDSFIGFGNYQLITFTTSCALSTNYGNLTLLLSLLLKLYKQELDITMNKVILMAVIHRIGSLLAGIFVLKFNNIIGRIKIIKYSLLILACAQLSASIAEKYFVIIFIFLFQGFQHGICAQYSQLLTIEVIPKNHRGQIAALVNLFHGIGSLYPILLWYLFCESYETGNHNAIHFCNFLLTITIYIFFKKYGRDNPRYYLSLGRFSECFYEIDYILEQNQCMYLEKLNNIQKDALIHWYFENFSETKKKKMQISSLFTKNTIKITIYVIAIQIIYYTATSIQQYLLPFIYHDKQQGFEKLFFQQMGIIPAVFIQSFFIDSQLFGRAKTAMLISILLCITYLTIFFQQETYIPQQILVRFLLEIQFTVMQIMINESFNSNLRALGLSFTYIVAKFSQLLSPVIIFKLYEFEMFLPFLFCGCMFLINGLLYATFPRERTNKALDLDLSESLSQSKKSESEY